MALLRGAADQLAAQGAAEEEDLGLAREAAAFYLKLSESVLAQTPGHLALAEAVASGFTQYAYAFVAFESERLEATDSRAALRQRQRAARLYLRAQRHAIAALEAAQPGLGRALASGAPLALAPEHVGLAYWAAAAWAAHIALSKDSPETVADLPLAMRLAQHAYEIQPGHGEGRLALLVAQLELARPGVARREAEARAQQLFDRADSAAGGRSAAVRVARAEFIAQPAGDRASFESSLREALRDSANRRDLMHQVLRERAQWLLDTADDRF